MAIINEAWVLRRSKAFIERYPYLHKLSSIHGHVYTRWLWLCQILPDVGLNSVCMWMICIRVRGVFYIFRSIDQSSLWWFVLPAINIWQLDEPLLLLGYCRNAVDKANFCKWLGRVELMSLNEVHRLNKCDYPTSANVFLLATMNWEKFD